MSSNITVTHHGERELAIRFEQFPEDLRARLIARIHGYTDELLARVQGATPRKTGELESEESERIFTDRADRIAGYVGVHSSSDNPTNDYAKAATLEYGTHKPRRAFERKSTLAEALRGKRRLIVGKLSKPVHIEALRYLRNPIKDMESEVLAGIASEVAQATAQANS